MENVANRVSFQGPKMILPANLATILTEERIKV